MTARVSHYTFSVQVEKDKFLLVNGLSGAIDLVSSGVADLLSTWEEVGEMRGPAPTTAASQLLARGYITEATLEDEVNRARTSCAAFKQRASYPKRHTIIVTYDCNFRCSYCYQHPLRRRDHAFLRQTMTAEMVNGAFAAIDQFDSSAPYRERARLPIGLYGGEPLLLRNKEIVEYILETGALADHSFTVVTNGFFLSEFAPLLSRYPVAHVHVTLDGPPEVHDSRRGTASGGGTFDRIMLGIREAREYQIPVTIRTTVDLTNAARVPELTPYLEALGFPEDEGLAVYISATSDLWAQIGCERRRLGEILDSYEGTYPVERLGGPRRNASRHIEMAFSGDSIWMPAGYFCKAENNSIWYDPVGDLYTCLGAVGLKQHVVGTYPAGLDLNDNYELWTSRTAFNLPECQYCKYAPVCGGGCALAMHRSHGTILRGNCHSLRVLLEGYIPFLYRTWKRRAPRTFLAE